MSIEFNTADLLVALPVLFIIGWGCLLLLTSAFLGPRARHLGGLASIGLAIGIAVCVYAWRATPNAETIFGGMLVVDRFALFIDVIVLLAGLITALVAQSYLVEHRFARDEFHALLVLSTGGMLLLVHAGSIVMFVIGLESMSLAVYALVASWGEKRVSAEGGIKYYVMGAVASAFLLYGFALLYGATGQTTLVGIGRRISELGATPMVVVGMLMILGAMAFKVAVVPFHMWAPDAYEGAPTPITGFMAAAVKAAAFGALIRVAHAMFSSEAIAFGSAGWKSLFWTLAALSMTVGNLAALRQRNIKRMLAYSSVAHAGYLVLGLLLPNASSNEGVAAMLFYLLAYAAATLGAFGVVAWIGRYRQERLGVSDWAGLAKERPTVAAAMTLFLLSLAGMPPTVGFFGKFYLFRAALNDPQLVSLVVIAVINSVISMFYYLRPIVAMYFQDGKRTTKPLSAAGIHISLAASAIIVILLGIFPGPSLRWALASLIGG